jgi:hypothetical protein
MSSIVSCPGIIALISGNIPNYTVIPRLEVWEAWRTIGVRPAPDGNYQKEGEFLLNKANQYANRLSTSNLTKMDIFIFHRSTCVPSMTYSLLATPFDPKTLNTRSTGEQYRPSLTSLEWTSHFLDVLHLDQRTSVEWHSWTWVLNKVYGKYNILLIICSHATLLGTWFLLHSESLQLESGCGFHLLENPSKWVP